MNFTLDDQLWCVLVFYICGLLLGVVYDVFRFLRTQIFTTRRGVFVCDVFFMIIFSLASVVLSMAYSFGRLRYFSVFAQILGLLSVRFTIGRFSVDLFGFLYKKLTGVFKKILIKSKKTLKKLLQPICNLLYNKGKKGSPVRNGVTDN